MKTKYFLSKYSLPLIIAVLIHPVAFGQTEKLTKVVAGFPVNYTEDSVGR